MTEQSPVADPGEISSETVAAVLSAALDLLAGGWVQGRSIVVTRDRDGHVVSVARCASQALVEAGVATPGLARVAHEKVNGVLATRAAAAKAAGEAPTPVGLPSFNDHRSTTMADIAALFEAAAH